MSFFFKVEKAPLIANLFFQLVCRIESEWAEDLDLLVALGEKPPHFKFEVNRLKAAGVMVHKPLAKIMQMRLLDFMAMFIGGIMSRKQRGPCGLHLLNGLGLFSMLGVFQGGSL